MGTPTPLGMGDFPAPPQGNALLTTASRGGIPVQSYLWLSSLFTDLNLSLDSAQTKSGVTHRPIRIQSRYVSFTVLFSVKNRPKFELLNQRIRDHWVYNLNGTGAIAKPMTLHCFTIGKVYQGFIGEEVIGHAWNQVIYAPQFTMSILGNTDVTPAQIIGDPEPFVPHRGDVGGYSDWEWYSVSEEDAWDLGGSGRHGPGGGTIRK